MTSEIISALTGGILIGISVSLMLGLIGKVTGISGIVEGVFFEITLSKNLWKVFFVLGLLVGALIIRINHPEYLFNNFNQSFWLTTLGGLLVGFGTRLGNGCTSGHGVCGISRLSIRSLVATFCFLLMGIITVTVTTHLLNMGLA